MCVEWLKLNGPPALPRRTNPPEERPLIRALTESDVVSFRARGVEVLLESEGLGEVWLVPEYTGQSRLELTIEHAALLAAVTAAFPDAKVTRLTGPKKPAPEKS
jgi:hypothetical protein